LAELPGGAEKVYDDLKVLGGGDSCSTRSNSKRISTSSLDKEESDCDDRAREFQGIFLAIDPLMAVCQVDIEVDDTVKGHALAGVVLEYLFYIYAVKRPSVQLSLRPF